MEHRQRYIIRGVKLLCFLLVLCFMFVLISSALVNPEPNIGKRHFQWIRGFYEETDNSLDAVFIGSSSVYSSWEAPIAYGKYGIMVYPFTSASQPLTEASVIIDNIREKQNNAIFILSTNSIAGYDHNTMHYILDYIPLTHKLRFVREMAGIERLSSQDTLEYLFPIIRFHERWDKLSAEDFHYDLENLKGGSHYDGFLSAVTDVSEEVEKPLSPVALDPGVETRILDLLDYCERANVTVLFVSTPWVGTKAEIERIKAVNDLIKSKGFTVLDLMDHMEDLGLNTKEDYYDIRHTNIHGALKITDYLSQYLLAHYDFPEKAGGYYKSWDEAYVNYKAIITPYLTEEELSQLP